MFVQVATFSDPERTMQAARAIGARADLADGVVRVRIGPLAETEGQAVLARVRSSGYQDARLVRDPDPVLPYGMEPSR